MFKHNLKAVLNTQRSSQGLYPVRIRQTISRKVTYHRTGIMLAKDQLQDGEVIKHPNKALLNTTIRIKINEIEKQLLEASILGEDLTKIKKNANITFLHYATRDIEKHKGLWSISTVRHKSSYLTKIETFRHGLKLSAINNDLLSEMEDYCRKIGNNDNTVWSCTKYIKTVINSAVNDGTLAKNPLKGFKGVKYSNPLREVVTQAEITMIEGFADSHLNSAKLLNVAAWFVLGCYTGLRYADMINFKGLVNGKILLQTQKTDAVISIFATEQIKRAIERLKNPIYTNQKCNEYITSIIAILGIEKKISWHSARHSFAVNFLENGGRIEILSKILGHSTLTTTQIYAKISTKLADAEMVKVWNEKPQPGKVGVFLKN